jgi:hypothetical protein
MLDFDEVLYASSEEDALGLFAELRESIREQLGSEVRRLLLIRDHSRNRQVQPLGTDVVDLLLRIRVVSNLVGLGGTLE